MSAGNRGTSNTSHRKRVRADDDDDMLSSSPALPSSPPLLPTNENDDDDLDAEDDLIGDIDDADEMAEDEDGIDLFGDNFMRDYRPDQDNTYQGRMIDDDGEYEEINEADRRQLEARMNKRDRELAQRRRMPAAFLQDEDEDAGIDLTKQPRRRRHAYDEDQDDMDLDDNIMEEELSLETLQDVKATNITEWVTLPPVSRTINREFKAFLTEYIDAQGMSVYGTRIRTLGEVNSESLEVSYEHLSSTKAILAYFVANAPTEVLKIFDQAAFEIVKLHYPNYDQIHPEVHVRIAELPVHYTLRQLRQSHLNCLVRVSGVVTRRTGVFPQLQMVRFTCEKCNITLGPYAQDSTSTEVKLTFCSNCQSRGPFKVNTEQTVYRNYQKLTLQESPGTVPAGRLPRHREVVLLADLIDAAKPGEEVEITAIYRNNYSGQLNNKNGFPVFATMLEANNIIKTHDQLAGFRLTEEDERQIRALSRDPGVIEKIVDSIAPSIYGHKDIKTAVALSLFGGVSKVAQGKMNIRGDINVLLLGDPGTAKSQVLKYVEKTAHRAVFATGQGASAVGLTASVRRDPLTSEWTLEGGALVLADQAPASLMNSIR
ncbi:DNA replication licensing factor mcm2 [Cyphellophora attinorum]|uniref:DNA replication licensing factor MCM2 n=1 Tax=Cyphellophora attinorum TaxID=1664694 RepID=A0A0N1HUT8_9EURO|nr:DNA replication licensing factor mcm2 [Phialophora attinorum]KPI43272.1 DNA replication licensing factor mcm2 [Phialophora attinorum]